MTRKKKPLPWQQEFEWATIICVPHGCTVERSDAMFERRGDGVTPAFYVAVIIHSTIRRAWASGQQRMRERAARFARNIWQEEAATGISALPLETTDV